MSVKGAHAAEFAEFERHKKILLSHLRNAHKLGPKTKPFDEDDLWHRLKIAAFWAFDRLKVQQKPMLPAKRKKRLCDLAKALAKAGREADKAMRDAVRSDVFQGWCTVANISLVVRNSNGSSAFVSSTVLNRINDDFKKLVEGLATLEAAASRAARDVHTKPGTPSGTGILPSDDINALMGVYRRTGQEPDLRAAPFAQFVDDFLTAMGRSDETINDYTVEALRYAHKRARKKAQRSAASPIDE